MGTVNINVRKANVSKLFLPFFPVVTYNLANVQQIFQFSQWKKKKKKEIIKRVPTFSTKLGCFYFTGFKWKEVAQVFQAPKGTLIDQQHLLPGAPLSLGLFCLFFYQLNDSD